MPPRYRTQKDEPLPIVPRSDTPDERRRFYFSLMEKLDGLYKDVRHDLDLCADYSPSRSEWAQVGFAEYNDTTITFDDSTRIFSIQPDNDSYDYYQAGIKYTATGDTVKITDVEGIHFIYYDNGVLTAEAEPPLRTIENIIRLKVLVSIIYWNATDSEAIYVGDERHGSQMSPSTHSYLHFTQGLQFLSGLLLNTMSVDDATPDSTSAQFGVDTGDVTDEDHYKYIPAIGGTTGLPIYYMLGSEPRWVRHVEAGFSVMTFNKTSSTRLAWNEFTGGSWQLTEIATNRFVLCHVFATTEKDNPMIAVMGQADYNSKVDAQAGAQTEIDDLVLDDVLFPEITPVATIIFQTALSYANDVNAKVVSTDTGDDYVDWRNNAVTGTGGSGSGVTDHGSLTGLGDDDHSIYILADGTRAFSGNQSFGDNNITNVGIISLDQINPDGSTISINGAYTIPTVDGTALQVLQTNGTGTVSWATVAGGGSSPLTTKGDLYGFTTVDARLPIGANGYPLVADSTESTGLKWGTNTLNLGDSASASDTVINFLSSGLSNSLTYDQSADAFKTSAFLAISGTYGSGFVHLPSLFDLQPTYSGTYMPEAGVVKILSKVQAHPFIGGTHGVLFGKTICDYVPVANAELTGMEFGTTFVNTGMGSTTYLTTYGIKTYSTSGVLGTTSTKESTSIKVFQVDPATPASGSTVNCTTMKGIDILDLKSGPTYNVNNLYQLYIEKPTAGGYSGGANYQVYLLGNGAGSGIWFDGAERLYSDGTNLVTNCGVSVNNAYTLPTTDGTAGQVLTTNGSGVVSWV